MDCCLQAGDLIALIAVRVLSQSECFSDCQSHKNCNYCSPPLTIYGTSFWQTKIPRTAYSLLAGKIVSSFSQWVVPVFPLWLYISPNNREEKKGGNCALSRLLNMASSLVKPAVTNRPTLEFLLDHLWQPPMISREQEGKRSRQRGVEWSWVD